MKILFTIVFLVWEFWLRVRGTWRRREWSNLRRHYRALAYAAFVTFGGFFLVSCILEVVWWLK
jgi:hypothetical protein